MKDGSNNVLVHKNVNDLEIKAEIIQKKFSVLSLTLILISINTPMTYFTHALLYISDLFKII